MNDYIVLDGKRYATSYPAWKPSIRRPKRVRLTLQGDLDATFAASEIYEWFGVIHAPVVPKDTAYGSIDDLRSTIAKNATIVFTDHYGTSYDVAIVSTKPEESHGPDWDNASNEWYVSIHLVGKSV